MLKTANEAVNEVFEGYKLRWRIEEFHRQIKQDFALEEITCRKYSKIKSIGAMLTVVMGFVAMGCELSNECLLTITRQKLHKQKKCQVISGTEWWMHCVNYSTLL